MCAASMIAERVNIACYKTEHTFKTQKKSALRGFARDLMRGELLAAQRCNPGEKPGRSRAVSGDSPGTHKWTPGLYCQGKGASGSNRKAESSDAPERDGLPRSSAEAAEMAMERRRQVIAVHLGQPVRREEPFVQRKAAAFARWHEPDDARVSCPDL
jgi:hypothetical protein